MHPSTARHSVANANGVISFLLKFLRFCLFLLFCLTPHTAAAASAPPWVVDTQDDHPSHLGILGTVERNFLDGVEAYERGDYARAIKIWRSPAEQGHMLAQFNLGVAYATGQGIDVNFALAARWWQLAAYQGHTAAQYNLGMLFSRGQGVEKSLSLASMWWYMAAMGGNDAAAQFQLGALAATGVGGTQDFSEAVRWWTRSAAQGYEHAVKGLEILKQHGTVELSKH